MDSNQRPGNSRSGRPRSKRARSAKKEQWLNNRFIKAIRKMKLAGLKQALKPGIVWTERLFWFGVFCLCLAYTAVLTVSTVHEYSAKPILNTFHDDGPIHKIPFPGTTITGTTVFKNNAIRDSLDLLEIADLGAANEIIHEGQTWTRHLVDVLVFTISHLCELVSSFAFRTDLESMSTMSEKIFERDVQWAKAKNISIRDNLNDEGFRSHIFPFVRKKMIDCKKIIAACLWEGKKENCTELFVPIQTDVGSGCSFNRIPEHLLRKRQGLMSLLHNHTYEKKELDAWNNYKLDSVISEEGLRDLFDERLHPRAQHHAGKMRGLSFMVSFDEDVDGLSCPIVDSYGYLVGIHSPFEEPQIMQTGLAVPPLNEVFVKVKAEVTIADKQIEQLGIAKRKCYFQRENPLDNFKYYTVANCHQECLAMRIKRICHCSLLTQSEGNEVLCGSDDVMCVDSVSASMGKKGYDKICRDPVCYPPCTEIKYDADASYLPYYKTKDTENQGGSSDLITSIVHVTFGSNSFSTRERKLQYAFPILVGVIGGTWGMTLEFSVYTIFNIIAGLLLLIASNCPFYNEQDKEELNQPCDEEAPAQAVNGTEADEDPDHVVPSSPQETRNENNENIAEDPNELSQDSVEDFSSIVSDTSSSSSSSETNTVENETETTPTEVDDAAESINEPHEEDTAPEEPGPSSELSESALTLQEPIDWDKVLDELLELVKD